MSVLKNLKSLFVVVEEESASPAPSAAKTAAPPKPTATAGARPTPSAPPTGGGPRGKVTSQFSEVLLGALEKNNLDGFDYLEFKRSLQSLEKMPMDEATRFQSAYAMAQTMGATPAHLVKTAQHYLSVLAKEEEQFNAALANQQERQIAAKQQAQLKLEETIKAKEAQIRQLQADIKAHQQEMEGIAQEIAGAVGKIDGMKNDFHASYENLVTQINQDVESMQKYLK